VSFVTRRIYGEDVLEGTPGLEAHRELMLERPTVRAVRDAARADQPTFLKHIAEGGVPAA
jgi:hypothetical protein